MATSQTPVVLPNSAPKLVKEHAEKGYHVVIDNGVNVFVRDEGPKVAQPVIMVHGVPSSSILYSKMFEPLVTKGYRAISFDLPGMGLSDKPAQFDYSWRGLKTSITQVIKALQLDQPADYIIHDIGGPLAMWHIVENPEMVRSVTTLDTLLGLESFQKPFPMNLLTVTGVRDVFMATMIGPVLKAFFSVLGVYKSSAFTLQDGAAWSYLLKKDGGKESFLKIMRGFEVTKERQDALISGFQAANIPLLVVWAKHERSIPLSQLTFIQENYSPKATFLVEGRHFLQVESPNEIVSHFDGFVQNLVRRSEWHVNHNFAIEHNELHSK